MKDPTPSDHRKGRTDRRSLITVAVMITGIIAVALVGPAVADTVSDQLDQPDVESLTDGAPEDTTSTTVLPETTVAPRSTDVPDTSAAPDITAAPDTSAAPDTTAAPDTSAPAVPTTALPAQTAPTAAGDDPDESLAPIETIQLVPALRDVIVEISGVEYASDQNGIISIEPSVPDATFEFIGVRAVPSLRDVAFGRWADGNPDSRRRLAEVAGPVAQLGVVLSHRVTVSSQQSLPDDARIVFESEAGSLELDVGRTAWVPASRAVETEDGLVEQPLTYRISNLVVGDDVSAIDGSEFTPTPEALWVADVAQ